MLRVLLICFVIYFFRTSTDLFKTVFDLMVSVTLFVGRFDMRMMQVKLKYLFSFLSLVKSIHVY